MSDWNYIDDKLPLTNGTYLCVARVSTKTTRVNHVFLNDWDNKRKAFTYDLNRQDKKVGSEEERIYAWLPYKQPPNPRPTILK